MHGVTARPDTLRDSPAPVSKTMLLLLVTMTGLAPMSLYMLVPALPVLATDFSRDISIAQMTVSLYMVGLACSQIVMGPLSDRFGRRPVLMSGFCLMIAARFFQAVGGATGMVVSRAIIRDLYPRERVGAMISLVVAALMIGQMISPLAGGLLEHAFGWRSIFHALTAAAILVAIAIACRLPETRRVRDSGSAAGFLDDARSLLSSRAFNGYMLCQVLASALIFTFAGAGPYVVVTQMGRSTVEYGAWFATSGIAYLIGNLCCVRYAPHHALDRLIWFGLALQLGGAVLNLVWGVAGLNQTPSWLFITHKIGRASCRE